MFDDRRSERRLWETSLCPATTLMTHGGSSIITYKYNGNLKEDLTFSSKNYFKRLFIYVYVCMYLVFI